MADKSRKGLGKGLDSIFGTNVEQFLDEKLKLRLTK